MTQRLTLNLRAKSRMTSAYAPYLIMDSSFGNVPGRPPSVPSLPTPKSVIEVP